MTEMRFRQRILPAVRAKDGEVYTGPRGAQHIDIRYNYKDEHGPLKGEAGFYDPTEKRFYPKYGKDGLNIDSQRLEPHRAMLPSSQDIERPNWDITEVFKKIPVDKYNEYLRSYEPPKEP